MMMSGMAPTAAASAANPTNRRPLVSLLDGRDCSIEMPILKDVATVAFCDAQTSSEIHDKVLNEAYGAFLWDCITLQKEDLLKFKALKVLIKIGSGCDNIDVAAASELGIALSNIPHVGIEETADSTIAHILNLFRQNVFWTNALKDASKKIFGPEALRENGTNCHSLRGKTLGIVGLGRTGSAVALRAKVFGLQVIFYDPNLPDGIEISLGVEKVESLTELLHRSDCVTLHCSCNPNTRNMINELTLKSMKQGAFLVNTASAHLIDEMALAAMLREGRVAGAAIDVHQNERTSLSDGPLADCPNLTVTPHCSWYSPASDKRMREAAAHEMRRIIISKSPSRLRYCVNADLLAFNARRNMLLTGGGAAGDATSSSSHANNKFSAAASSSGAQQQHQQRLPLSMPTTNNQSYNNNISSLRSSSQFDDSNVGGGGPPTDHHHAVNNKTPAAANNINNSSNGGNNRLANLSHYSTAFNNNNNSSSSSLSTSSPATAAAAASQQQQSHYSGGELHQPSSMMNDSNIMMNPMAAAAAELLISHQQQQHQQQQQRNANMKLASSRPSIAASSTGSSSSNSNNSTINSNMYPNIMPRFNNNSNNNNSSSNNSNSSNNTAVTVSEQVGSSLITPSRNNNNSVGGTGISNPNLKNYFMQPSSAAAAPGTLYDNGGRNAGATLTQNSKRSSDNNANMLADMNVKKVKSGGSSISSSNIPSSSLLSTLSEQSNA